MPQARLFRPSEVLLTNDASPVDFSGFAYRFLAQGDSWFSIGTLNLIKNSNLLQELAFKDHRCIVNCAQPGATLSHMVDQVKNPNFKNLLCGVQREPWHGLIVSAGGNDMIDALGHKDIADPALRLFLTPAERTGDLTDCENYLSSAGWATFEAHIRAVFAILVALRDETPTNRGIPIFLHTYHFPTIRNAGAGLNFGPWLYKACKSFSIPDYVWPTLGRRLFNRFGELLNSIALSAPNFHVFDTANLVPLIPAHPDKREEDGDWINEIHLTQAGYQKLSLAWAKEIEFILP